MDTSILKGSRFEGQMRATINLMRDFEKNPPPDDVADAVLDAISSTNPKRRYLVVPVAGQAQIALRTLMDEIAQMNDNQKYSISRDSLVKMLDDSASGPNPQPAFLFPLRIAYNGQCSAKTKAAIRAAFIKLASHVDTSTWPEAFRTALEAVIAQP